MTAVDLAHAKARSSELVDRGSTGEAVVITRHGKPVARLTAVEKPWEPIGLDDLKAFARSVSKQSEPAGDVVRRMRDEDRS